MRKWLLYFVLICCTQMILHFAGCKNVRTGKLGVKTVDDPLVCALEAAVLLPDAHESIKMMIKIADRYKAHGKKDMAEDVLDKSWQFAEKIKDPSTIIHVADMYAGVGRYDNAEKLAATLDFVYMAQVFLSIAESQAKAKNFDRAMKNAEKIQAEFGNMKSMALASIAVGYARDGQKKKALDLASHVLETAPPEKVEVLQAQLGLAHGLAGDSEKAEKILKSALQDLLTHDPPVHAPLEAVAILGHFIPVYAELGDQAKASELTSKAIEKSKAITKSEYRAFFLLYPLSEEQSIHKDDVRRVVSSVLEALEESRETKTTAMMYADIGETYRKQGTKGESMKAFSQAFDTATGLEKPDARAAALCYLAIVLSEPEGEMSKDEKIILGNIRNELAKMHDTLQAVPRQSQSLK